jgi:hypothetical protein
MATSRRLAREKFYSGVATIAFDAAIKRLVVSERKDLGNTVGVAIAGMNLGHHGVKMPSERKMKHPQ